jgi:membrane protease YdiL (CAAX protease family)
MGSGVKECPQCGSQSSEAALSCQGCGTSFPADEIKESTAPLSGEQTNLGLRADSSRKERQLPLIELLLVCFVGFGGALFLSLYILFTGTTPSQPVRGDFRWWYTILHQVGVLALLWYVLQRRSQSFSDLGLFWKAKEVAVAPLLWFVCSIAAYISQLTIRGLGGFPSKSDPNAQAATFLFSSGIGFGTMVFQFVNPFFEELIARAYLITRLKELTNSLALAVITSVVFQVSYHFYQGGWTALSHTGVFLLLSLYYAKTNRILAPILAHMIFDVSATLYYMLKPVN